MKEEVVITHVSNLTYSLHILLHLSFLPPPFANINMLCPLDQELNALFISITAELLINA